MYNANKQGKGNKHAAKIFFGTIRLWSPCKRCLQGIWRCLPKRGVRSFRIVINRNCTDPAARCRGIFLFSEKESGMNIGIIGLGLIGGSMAKAISSFTPHRVFGADLDGEVIARALSDGAIAAEMGAAECALCDMILIALYPGAAIRAAKKWAPYIKKGALMVDLCGTKQGVCAALEPLAKEHGFQFIGGHPMAGREQFGYQASNAGLFRGASMVLTPAPDTDSAVLEKAQEFFYSLGFGRMRICTAAEHDRMIAYTSQLAHVVSSAYVQSEASLSHLGFSAGSFQDMTRVARLYEPMWTELFLNNAQPLADEIDGLIERLKAFSDAIRGGDRDALFNMLHAGRERKELLNAREQERTAY